MQLLKDPCQQADRAVGERIAQGLGFRALLVPIAGTLAQHPTRPFPAVLILWAVGGHEVLEIEEWVRSERWRMAPHHVDVGGAHMVGEAEAHDPSHHGSPVSTLGDCQVRCESAVFRKREMASGGRPYLLYPSFSISL